MKKSKPRNSLYLSAKQAAAELNVAIPTVYAYVSRGLLRSVKSDESRAHVYFAEDVRKLKSRRESLGRNRTASPEALSDINWGAPILETSTSLIADNKLYYCGIDACALAESSTLEEVATILWACDEFDPFAADNFTPHSHLTKTLLKAPEVDPITRTLSVLPHFAVNDDAKYNATPSGRWLLAARIVKVVASAIVSRDIGRAKVHDAVALAWTPDTKEAADLYRRALVLCAEHELNVSTFTVRCAVSSGATLYHSIIAGLSALTGPKHGGATLGMNALLDELTQQSSVKKLVRRRLESGQAFRGFNHPLYPAGDPRAYSLINAVKDTFPGDPFLLKVDDLLAAIEKDAGATPTIDFALSLVARVLRLPEHAGICLFAMGRTVGWLAHAIEQETTNTLIRPRARYSGPPPREKL